MTIEAFNDMQIVTSVEEKDRDETLDLNMPLLIWMLIFIMLVH